MPSVPKILRTLRGVQSDTPPIWIMRQAGRYLPEYLAVRQQAGDFLTLCYTPDLAAEVTLQPIDRFDLDAAIIFSDILVVSHGLGQKVWFEAGEGPRLEPLTSMEDIKSLDRPGMKDRLSPVYEAVSKVRAKLPEDKALIGFCGAPWTVATYMIEGGGSKDHVMTRAFAYRHPDAFSALIDILVDASIEHLKLQIAAGAQIVQVFDSWAGSLTAEGFSRWCSEPIARIASAIRAHASDVPVIGFPRGAGAHLPGFVSASMVDAVALDTSADLDWVRSQLPATVPMQGNLDPALMLSDADQVRDAVFKIRRTMRGRPHVLNLGHGIPKEADIAMVEALISAARMPLGDLMALAHAS
ncbi:MAG: uroporphyrinogen decarboxylase [Pseudomonadota bacterium]